MTLKARLVPEETTRDSNCGPLDPKVGVLTVELSRFPILYHTTLKLIITISEECTAIKQDAFSIEPSPFTASNHPLLCHLEAESIRPQLEAGVACETEYVWQDGLCVNPEATSLHQATSQSDYHHSQNDCSNLIASHWDFGNPGRIVKKKSKGRTSSREKSKDRSRFNSRFPFHKKAEALDELAWALDHNEMLGGAGAAAHGGAHGHGHGSQRGGMGSMRPPGSVRALDSIVHSPASVGAVPTPLTSAMTPKGGPGSVRTPGDFSSMNSPADCKPPHTPKSVPPSYPVASPYPQSEKKHDVKTEFEDSSGQSSSTSTTAASCSSYVNSSLMSSGVKSELTSSEHLSGEACSLINLKRPLLPVKEYEAGLQSEMGALSDSIYDTVYLQHWLNHPVKKFRPSEPKNGDPLRPMYRPRLGHSPKVAEGRLADGGESNASAKNSAESSSDNNNKRANALNSDPYEFSDGQDIKKELKVNKYTLRMDKKWGTQLVSFNF